MNYLTTFFQGEEPLNERNERLVGQREDVRTFIRSNRGLAAIFNKHPDLLIQLLRAPVFDPSPQTAANIRNAAAQPSSSVVQTININDIHSTGPLPFPPTSPGGVSLPPTPPTHSVAPTQGVKTRATGQTRRKGAQMSTSSPTPSRRHSTLDPRWQIEFEPTQDVIFLKDSRKPSYLQVRVVGPSDVALVVVNLDGDTEVESRTAKPELIKDNQYKIKIDTTKLYKDVGVQVLRLRAKDRQSGQVLAQKDFHYIVYSKSTQRPKMFMRVAMQELQYSPTWDMAWQWVTHFWNKRCYRDLTGKQKNPPPLLPLPSGDTIRQILKLRPGEAIDEERFEKIIDWISYFYTQYHLYDVQSLMNCEIPNHVTNEKRSIPGVTRGSILHMLPPRKIEVLLKGAHAQTRRPSFCLRFASTPETLALTVIHKGDFMSAQVSMTNLRVALTHIFDQLKLPEYTEAVAVVASEPPTYITCDLSQIEEKLKQLKCMQNNTVDPHYTSLAQVGKALSEQEDVEPKRKRREFGSSPFTSNPTSPGAEVGCMKTEDEAEEEPSEEEMDQGQVVMLPDVLFEQARAQGPEAMQRLFLLLSQEMDRLAIGAPHQLAPFQLPTFDLIPQTPQADLARQEPSPAAPLPGGSLELDRDFIDGLLQEFESDAAWDD